MLIFMLAPFSLPVLALTALAAVARTQSVFIACTPKRFEAQER